MPDLHNSQVSNTDENLCKEIETWGMKGHRNTRNKKPNKIFKTSALGPAF